MTTHRLHAEMLVDRPIDEVFAFFAKPENLGRITPSSLGFELLSTDTRLREGLEIDYRVRPLLGIPLSWRSVIAQYDPPRGFRDIQVKGPYRSWDHRHSFVAEGDRTRVIDDVEYSLPLGPLGLLAYAAVVRGQLEEIFRHRTRTIRAVFAKPALNDHPMAVAVAGGSGFVGGAIAAELFARGHRPIVLSRQGPAARGPLPDTVAVRHADAVQSDGLVEALAGVDALAIALAFNNSPMEAPGRGQTFMEVDAVGTEHLVAAAREAGVKRVVYLSGAGAAPDATRHWFRAKWRAEEAIRGSGMAWTIIRPTWIYGPRDASLNRFIGFARQLQAVPMTNFGGQLLAPAFIDDIGRLAADSLVDPAAIGQAFEVGGPETLTMREVITRALRTARIRRPIIPGPAALIRLVAAPLTLLPSPPLTPDAVDFINQPAIVDVGPLLQRMPRRLTPLDEGLASYLGRGDGRDTITIDGSLPTDGKHEVVVA
ncbi:MAG: NAD(P)H-binding protein [Chloroflexi bacterium]|nr:NAD(P)H-binding protein [Chloroflexota bacterium]